MRLILVSLAALWLLAGGCSSMQLRPWGQNAVSSTATKEQIVALVNRNIEGVNGRPGLTSWSCMQARFEMGPLMKASGNVIVQAPNSFRLRVFPPLGGGDLLDVGSNNDEFWIWQQGMEDQGTPLMLTAHHQDMGVALQHFKIPFQPDWIMEVMGVVAIDAAQYELRQAPSSRQLELVSPTRLATGQRVQKIIRVDPKRGQVTGHELWGENNQLIARAEFSDHRADKATQVLMPRKIKVHWPQEDLNLGITLDHVQVNPPHLPELAWTMPEKPGVRKIDMGAFARQAAGAAHDIQPVEHEPRLESRLDPSIRPGNAAPPRAAEAQAEPGGARPFPGGAPMEGIPANPAAESPLPSSGRVRIDALGP